MAFLSCGFSQAEDESARVSSGLLALYDFGSLDGDLVRDRSGVGRPLDLKITKLEGVKRWDGTLEVTGNTEIYSRGKAQKINTAIKRSREITIEAWVKPSNTKQKGPARIVTLSRSGTERNFTLGQEGSKYDVRFRTSKTSGNGLPSLSSEKRSCENGDDTCGLHTIT